MAIYTFTAANSVFLLGGSAFSSGTAVADTLNLLDGAYLHTNSLIADAVVLQAAGAWTANINGSIFSLNGHGLRLESGLPASVINVGTNGTISGAAGAIIAKSAVTITNRGSILQDLPTAHTAIEFYNTGVHRITNYGEISGYDHSIVDTNSLGTEIIVNSGVINGRMLLFGGNDQLTNTNVVGQVDFGNGSNKLTNSGATAGIRFGSGNDIVTNSGYINGAVVMGLGVNTLTNTGTIAGTVYIDSGGTVARNSGNILGSFDSDNGFAQATATTLTNYIMQGSVKVSGKIAGEIHFGYADDRFYGGENNENVHDQFGADRYELGGGNDRYTAFFEGLPTRDAVDYVDGGTGTDGLVLHDMDAQTITNLDTVSHRNGPGFLDANGYLAAANTVLWRGAASERVYRFENVDGTPNSDVIYGNAAGNVLIGNEGSDVLQGYAGNDSLSGGGGVDVLVGGSGRDYMTGGTSNDSFVFVTAADSQVGSKRDLVADFQPTEGDHFVFTPIDANTVNGSATNENFTSFIGTNTLFAANAPGTLRAIQTQTGWLLEGNTDNDRDAEFQIEVRDLDHSIMWSMGLFFA